MTETKIMNRLLLLEGTFDRTNTSGLISILTLESVLGPTQGNDGKGGKVLFQRLDTRYRTYAWSERRITGFEGHGV